MINIPYLLPLHSVDRLGSIRLRAVLEYLENESKHIDEIGRSLNFPAPKFSAPLLKMEISGLVQSMGRGIYCRK